MELLSKVFDLRGNGRVPLLEPCGLSFKVRLSCNFIISITLVAIDFRRTVVVCETLHIGPARNVNAWWRNDVRRVEQLRQEQMASVLKQHLQQTLSEK